MYDVERCGNINRIWSTLIVETFYHKGIKSYFTSPGLRNAPLLSAVTGKERIKTYSGIDERSMAYRALGYAKASGKPGVLVCTSGTAMANYMPAVIEAFQSNIPLLILSADRPKRLVEAGDNQSIKQQNMYGSFIRAELDLEVPSESTSPQELTDKLSRFLTEHSHNGPVHINLPFEEPLDQQVDNTSSEYRKKAGEVRFTEFLKRNSSQLSLPQLSLEKKTLLVLGPTPEFQSTELLAELVRSSNLPCLIDIGSGLKFSDIDHQRILPSFEHPEVSALLKENRPEQIIHLGGRLVSKHYYNFLKSSPKTEVLLVGNENLYTHPADSPKWELKMPLDEFYKIATETGFLNQLTPFTFDCKDIIGKKEEVIEKSPFSFPVISKRIIELMPSPSALYLGNSTTIRSFDAFASTKTHNKKIKVLTHRGASGIEGFNAAALGFAEESNLKTVLVHGDIGFMHDLGSLLMLSKIKIPLINIVVNNKGGGIFDHLPISQDKETLPLIKTEHERDFKGLSEWLGITYFKASNIKEFEDSFKKAVMNEEVCLIEASVDQAENLAVYEHLKTLKL
ncbi:MAG: 2-succinyl-5-enolpyruvyl-6-hydroxy-3-cyclohexene-1-carboxylate synthase [Bacteriovoracaceae bacterium]|jgi:2-succinyl-5-enolpyruvyl-6-hydroxy-3-cyclohexene-1-carboxylate synthase